MKVLFADFEINTYGGIIPHVVAKVRALKEMGHAVDIVQLSSTSITQRAYDAKVAQFASGEWQRKRKPNSQNGGYEFDSATGYWKNNYYGFFLPPSHKIGVFEPDAVERWRALTADADVIMWNFMPTRNKCWCKPGGRKFDWWWRFFDLPTDRVKQVFIVHDAYFDVRACNIAALKDKIVFLDCAHAAGYLCCANIGIPRVLHPNPRFLPRGVDLTTGWLPKSQRSIPVFAAHMFKSMKHMEELIRAVPHLNDPQRYGDPMEVLVAGTGIEQMYMVADEKVKPYYLLTTKTDPDADPAWVGRRIWDHALATGMTYGGLMSSAETDAILPNVQWAVDPSWSSHYAQYSRTHINGFIIEAILAGAYPVLRDYTGLCSTVPEDPIFDALKAVVIPWDATPRQFAEALRRADAEISDEQYRADTLSNLELVRGLMDARGQLEETFELLKGDNVRQLECGVDSPNVRRLCGELMEGFFGIELPIEWETD